MKKTRFQVELNLAVALQDVVPSDVIDKIVQMDRCTTMIDMTADVSADFSEVEVDRCIPPRDQAMIMAKLAPIFAIYTRGLMGKVNDAITEAIDDLATTEEAIEAAVAEAEGNAESLQEN